MSAFNLMMDNSSKIASGVKAGAQWGWNNTDKVLSFALTSSS